jgi:hypothetical protein
LQISAFLKPLPPRVSKHQQWGTPLPPKKCQRLKWMVFKDKNPKLNKWNEFYLEGIDLGWTPLHEAAQHGHLVICYMIMNEITDKNPGNANGYTPLHAAALEGQLETFKLIMNKVTDINPRDNEGWTPLHGAACKGHQELCKFIVDKVEDKNPENDDGFTPHELLWNYICGTQYI